MQNGSITPPRRAPRADPPPRGEGRKIMRDFIALLLFAAALAFPRAAIADEEINLFDSDGRPVAYIVADDERTLYLWEGKAVAYLDYDGAGELDVFGFNGKHLGWFIGGV